MCAATSRLWQEGSPPRPPCEPKQSFSCVSFVTAANMNPALLAFGGFQHAAHFFSLTCAESVRDKTAGAARGTCHMVHPEFFLISSPERAQAQERTPI